MNNTAPQNPLLTVVSFLGRAISGDYRTARYVFGDDQDSYESKFFVDCLVKHIRSNPNQSIERLIVVGTSTSMWGNLYELVPEADEDLLDLCERIQGDTASADRSIPPHGVRSEDLTALQEMLAIQLGCAVSLLTIGTCQTETDQLQLVGRISDAIPNDQARLVFDITHSYRHLPILSLVAARYLQQTRACTTENIFYGMLEATQSGQTPVVDLSGLLRILDVTEAFSAWNYTGSLSPISSVFRDQLPSLDHAAFLLDSQRIPQSRKAAQTALQDLQALKDTHPLLALASSPLQTTLQDLTSKDVPLHNRQLEWARQALEADNLTTAAQMTYEAVITAAIRYLSNETDADNYEIRKSVSSRDLYDYVGKNATDRNAWRTLRHLRNALSHGTRSDKSDVQSALSNRIRCTQTLQDLHTWASNFIQTLSTV